MSIEPQPPPSVDPQRAFQLGLGAVSPMWPAYTVAASAGLAYWWWNRVARGEHLDLLAEAASFTPVAAESPPLAQAAFPPTEDVIGTAAELPAVVAETVAAPVEAMIETVAEAAAVAEAAVEPILEALEPVIEAVAAAPVVPEPIAEAVETAAETVIEAPAALVAEAAAAASPPAASEIRPAVSRLDQSLAAWAATTPKTTAKPVPAHPVAAAPKPQLKTAPKKSATKSGAKAKVAVKAAKKS